MEDVPIETLAKEADFRSRVNEKLLKALIGLLAVKDEHLLEELCTIVEHARRRDSESSQAVWASAHSEIGLFLDLVSDEGGMEQEVQRH